MDDFQDDTYASDEEEDEMDFRYEADALRADAHAAREAERVWTHLSFDALLEVCASNGATLREVCGAVALVHPTPENPFSGLNRRPLPRRVWASSLKPRHLAQLCAAAPHAAFVVRLKQNLFVDMFLMPILTGADLQPYWQRISFSHLWCTVQQRAETLRLAQFLRDKAVRVRNLQVRVGRGAEVFPDAGDAVVDAAIAAQPEDLFIDGCVSPRIWMAPLARLLRTLPALHLLDMQQVQREIDPPQPPAGAVQELAEALRAHGSLRILRLYLGPDARRTFAELVGALRAHPTLQALCLGSTLRSIGGARTLGAALASLLAADAPSLTLLHVESASYLDAMYRARPGARLGDALVRPLCDALPRNTHLRGLSLRGFKLSDALAATHAPESALACASLELVSFEVEGEKRAALKAMEARVAERPRVQRH